MTVDALEIAVVFPIRSALRWAALVGLVLSLAGCTGDSLRDALGMSKRAPDEFAVVKRQPLIIPPGYDLRPPQPGAPSATVASATTRARSAMTGGAATADAAPVVIGSADGPPTTLGPPLEPAAPSRTSSPGQQALLAKAGSVPGSEVRDQITAETEGRTRVEPAVFDRVLAQPATSGSAAPDVVSRERTPIDLQE
jgi:hypothetical protein